MSVKKNNALSDVQANMISSSDGSDITSGVTTTISKDGGTYVSTTNAAAHMSGGSWFVDLTATEMDADMVVVRFAGSGAITRSVTIKTETKITSDLNDISATDVWAAATRTLTANTNLNDPTAAAVATAVVGSTITELASIPAASPTMSQALALLYMALRNQIDVTASAKEIHTDGGTVLATKTLSDDGTSYSETKMA